MGKSNASERNQFATVIQSVGHWDSELSTDVPTKQKVCVALGLQDAALTLFVCMYV